MGELIYCILASLLYGFLFAIYFSSTKPQLLDGDDKSFTTYAITYYFLSLEGFFLFFMKKMQHRPLIQTSL
jgi:hypothetical protein